MPLRALIAEDEFLIALTLRRQLEAQGYEVVGVAGTGLEALRLCQLEHPDVVFMDIRMPSMDGITATRQLMEHCPHPTIIVTGNAERREEAEAAGAMEYTVKPLLPQQIPGLVENALARFARYMRVHEEAPDCAEALADWPVVLRVVRRHAAEARISEGEAFSRLMNEARAHGRTVAGEAHASEAEREGRTEAA